MTSHDTESESNPFADPRTLADRGHDRSFADSTLNVGRNASLTLGTDALIVLDDGLREESRLTCCTLVHTKSTTTRSIPYFNILWAAFSKVELTIHYARPTSKSSSSHAVRVAYIHYELDPSATATYNSASAWTARLLDRAYGTSQRNKRIKILINPWGGAGKAGKLYTRDIEPILAAARCTLDVEHTAYSGHAIDIAEKLDINAYDVLASCSGDGLPYECFNGLARKPDAAVALRKVAVVQFPCGTGNAMSWNLNGTGDCSLAALCVVKGLRTPLDLCSVTQGAKRTISFLSQSVGIVAETDLGTDNIRWMGDARFTFGFLVRLLGKTLYPCDIAVKTEIDDKSEIKRHYAAQRTRRKTIPLPNGHDDESSNNSSEEPTGLPPLQYGTVNSPIPADWTPLSRYANLGNFYAGNMTIMTQDAPFFPAALPADGLLDLFTIPGDISRATAVNLLLSVPQRTLFDKEAVRFRKVAAYRVVPRYGRYAEGQGEEGGGSRLGKALQRVGLGGRSGKEGERGDGYISVDGEKYPFEPFQVEVHQGLGTVLSRSGRLYESPGPIGWEEYSVEGDGEEQGGV